jgi:hypothetical protein
VERQIRLRIVLEKPTAGVLFGLQKGAGNDYETVQTQISKGNDLRFEFDVRFQKAKDGTPNFLGPFAQGPPQKRFVYLDIGTYAGQKDTEWSRRLKVPLHEIAWEILNEADPARDVLETRIAGTGRDGSPSCGTVKPFAGWKVVAA